MAKCKYERVILPKMNCIVRWAESGATNEEIAKYLHISRSTLQSYMNRFPELRDAIRGAKEGPDAIAEDSIFKMVTGYVTTVNKPMKIKHTEYDENGKRISEREEIISVEEELYIPPNPTSQIFWVKNRRPDKWRDKVEQIQETDSAIKLNVVLEKCNGSDD